MPGRVDDLARAVADLADALAATPARPGPTPAPSWLVAPTDAEVTRRLLDALVGWLRVVFLRYPDGAAVLPGCWLWHPDVVEELTWLMHAWLGAYQGPGASVQLAGDWHDRQRPGVIRRLRASVASCSIENHQTRPGWPVPRATAVEVPAIDAVGSIAGWWAHGRNHPAPEPHHPSYQHGGPGQKGNGIGDALGPDLHAHADPAAEPGRNGAHR